MSNPPIEVPPQARAIISEYLDAHRQLETAGAHAEDQPTPMPAGPKMAALMAAIARYATAYRALALLAGTPTREKAAKATVPSGKAIIDDRYPVSVGLWVDRPEELKDESAYFYAGHEGEFGPWRLIVDVDVQQQQDGHPAIYHLWNESGEEIGTGVDGGAIIYITKKHYNVLTQHLGWE